MMPRSLRRSRAFAPLVGLAAAAPLLAGCGAMSLDGSADGADGPGGPQVVTAFYALEYVADRVAGDAADVSVLTSPGTEPHDLELTVRQTAELSEADVLLYSSGLQPAVDDAADQSDVDRIVDAHDSADLIATGEEEGHDEHAADEHADEHGDEHGDEHAEEEAHDHGDEDPHFWMDPTRLSAVAAAFEAQLAEADPDNAATYADNLAALQSDLEELDAALMTGLESCAIDTVVVSHDAFGYFGDRYGLDMHAINGLSPDAEPSPAHLRELADLIREENITTVFSETLATTALADTLASELDLTTDVLDPIEGLGEETAQEDYLSLMRSNLSALQKANDCS